MSNEAEQRFDVLVIGGGPAGIAAAVRAAECRARVAIVDDNTDFGGQIWRGTFQSSDNEDAAEWSNRLRGSAITRLCGQRVFHQPRAGVLLAEERAGVSELHYEKLILTTGARERFLPFPGSTLPNVMGVGGLQAMVKSGLPIRGKRVVIAGTGPLLLAVAAYLRKMGAEILIICEQASWARLGMFAAGLWKYPGKIAQSLRLRREIAGIRFAANSWPLQAQGHKTLESVRISRNGESEVIACDYLACGFHLVPNLELPSLLGCHMQDGFVYVGDLQQTSVPGVFCAGEPTSIGGLESAVVEGQIAGFAAGGETKLARRLLSERRKAQHFARMLDRTFRLRPGLRKLSAAQTIVCRCEDVTYSQLNRHTSWRAAKLHTRCGMGPCQGRICGPATEFLFQWTPDSVRPPIFPARVESLSGGPLAAQHSSAVGGLE